MTPAFFPAASDGYVASRLRHYRLNSPLAPCADDSCPKKDVIKETALGPSHVVHEPSRDFWSWLKFQVFALWAPNGIVLFRSHFGSKLVQRVGLVNCFLVTFWRRPQLTQAASHLWRPGHVG